MVWYGKNTTETTGEVTKKTFVRNECLSSSAQCWSKAQPCELVPSNKSPISWPHFLLRLGAVSSSTKSSGSSRLHEIWFFSKSWGHPRWNCRKDGTKLGCRPICLTAGISRSYFERLPYVVAKHSKTIANTLQHHEITGFREGGLQSDVSSIPFQVVRNVQFSGCPPHVSCHEWGFPQKTKSQQTQWSFHRSHHPCGTPAQRFRLDFKGWLVLTA